MRRMYLAMERELVVATEEGNGWRAERHLAGMQPVCLAADPARPEVIYCGTYARGLYKSENAGDSWRPVGDPGRSLGSLTGEGIPHPNVMAVAVSSSERAGGPDGEEGVVYAGTEPSAPFRSEDGGESWRELTDLRNLPSSPTWSFPPRPHTSHVRWISPAPNAIATIYVSVEQGALVRSADGGKSFNDCHPGSPRDVHALAVHPDDPHRLYAAAGDGFLEEGTGYAESPDAGQSWKRPDEGLAHHYLWGLAVDPADPETVLISASASPRAAHVRPGAESFVYRKKSAGELWEQVYDGLPEPEGTIAPVLATNPAEPHAFYVLTNKGLFRSADAGESWRRLEMPWPERYLEQHQQALLVREL